ncbi:MAG: hypothetical protein GXO79_12600, partial [Chlorobi bacterium]|nr:hypothetical protein [Chlorobiota bacterium]
ILKKTVIDFDTYFHLLRHFNKIDAEFNKKFLTQTHYKQADIDQQMAKPGSKFLYSFAKNPEELIRNITSGVDYKSYYMSTEGKKTKISIEFDHEAYLKGIGLDGIAAIRTLDEDEKKMIEQVERDEFLIKRIKADKKKTWKLHLILFEKKDNYLFATFSPGIYAPPFPNKEVDDQDHFRKYSKFWNEHVMII